jgi:hypothetical protein
MNIVLFEGIHKPKTGRNKFNTLQHLSSSEFLSKLSICNKPKKAYSMMSERRVENLAEISQSELVRNCKAFNTRVTTVHKGTMRGAFSVQLILWP